MLYIYECFNISDGNLKIIRTVDFVDFLIKTYMENY